MSENPLKLKKIHHVGFYVGNAKQAAFYYRNAFGFSQIAYAGLETGQRELASYVMQQGRARFLLSTPLNSDHPASQHIRRHGDGIYDIALEVENADLAFQEAVKRGAKPALDPTTISDTHGSVRMAAVHTYGDTIHTLISYIDYDGPFLPGYVAVDLKGEDVGVVLIDHMVGNVELGKMEFWADWYRDVMGFNRYITFDDKDISTEYSALMSIVMADQSHNIKFPINEPAPGRRKSQIQEYLDFYQGPGVQHIALLCKDIISTVTKLRDNGVEFLYVPETYYENILDRVGPIEEPLEELKKLGILIDRDDEGYLLQIFTKPVEDRPTLFYEIIERCGCRGFGKGNFKALFESIEREQERRGNL